MTRLVVLGLMLGVACISDVRTRRIPNALVAVIALLGMVAALVESPALSAVARPLAGVGVGLTIWLPFWLMHMIGAGDVKLFAAAGAWLGPSSAVEAALLTAFVGGVLSLAVMIAQRGPALTIVRLGHALRVPAILRDDAGQGARVRLPYALAISAGVLGALVHPGLLL